MNLKTVIMAGGKGTRISEIAQNIPKPMIDIGGKPLLERQIECLKRQGITNITITVSHLASVIQDYFQEGKQLSINIEYIVEPFPLGTAGALYFVKETTAENILLINGDVLFDVNIEKFLSFHNVNDADVTLLTHPNSHPYDSAIIQTDSTSQIVGWINKEDERGYYKNIVNAGIHLLRTEFVGNVFKNQKQPLKMDLDREVLKPNLKDRKMFSYKSPEYVKDMGTPQRYNKVCIDFARDKPRKKNLYMMQRAVFLDRDDTLIYDEGFMTRLEQIRLLDGAAEAVAKINESGYLAIVVTNQPVIARGECTIEELELLHQKMETLLGEKGAYLDDIIFCPHHPDKGFQGERIEYKIECECRKPKPGMLVEAAQRYNIELSESIMVGDSRNDILAGKAAGCKTAYIGSEEKGIELQADIVGDNLLNIIEKVL